VASPLSQIPYKASQKKAFEEVPEGKEAAIELKGGARVTFKHKKKTEKSNFAVVEIAPGKPVSAELRIVERPAQEPKLVEDKN
jgi:hypothetical protein